MTQTALDFAGATYEPALDRKRLSSQLHKVFTCMYSGQWKTVPEIISETGLNPCSASGITARLRQFRSKGHVLQSRRREGGLWEYRLTVKE